jgi:toxin ParE1/3/4
MTAPWKIRQTPQAQKDRASIVRWTVRRFGARQALIYMETIALAMAALRDGPRTIGVKQRDGLPPGIFTLHVARNGRKGSHFIVFRVGGERTIDVLRILYDGMDLSSHV